MKNASQIIILHIVWNKFSKIYRYVNTCRLIFRKINGLLQSLNHKCLHKWERKCMSTCVLDRPAVGKGNYFCILLYQCIYNLFEDNIRIFWYNKNYNCYQRKRNTCMNNFPLLSLMCSCLTNMVFLLWTGGNLQFFSWCVCIFHTSCCLQSLFLESIIFHKTYILGCEVRRKSKSNPITPNMLPSPHCLKFLDASWSRQYKALSSTSKPPGNRPSSTPPKKNPTKQCLPGVIPDSPPSTLL